MKKNEDKVPTIIAIILLIISLIATIINRFTK